MTWAQIEPVMREKAYRAMDNDPQSLLETDGWPSGHDADMIFARLIGLDDEIVKDGLRLETVLPLVRLPLVPRLSLTLMRDSDPMDVSIRTANYVPTSAYALVSVSAEHAPPDVPLRPDFTIKVMYLKYRRRL